MRLAGSSSSIRSSRSSACGCMNENSSRMRRRYSFFGLKEWKNGRLTTSGQMTGLGVPHVLAIRSSWFGSEFAWNIGFLVNSSPNMHLWQIRHVKQVKDQLFDFLFSLPTAPNIDGWTIALLTKQQLWRSIPQCDHLIRIRPVLIILVIQSCQAEICQLYFTSTQCYKFQKIQIENNKQKRGDSLLIIY